MPLHASIKTATYDDKETLIWDVYIGRMEDLKKPNGIHRYSLSPVLHPWESKGEFFHEYSDGANLCTRKAIKEISHLLSASIPEEPLRIQINMAGYYSVERELVNFYVNKDSFPEIDTDGNQRYGIYQEVWPFEPVAEFTYASKGKLAGYLIKALETIEGEHRGKEQ